MGNWITNTLELQRARWQRLPVRVLAALLVLLAPTVHAQGAARTNFDHLTTGFELIGQHRDLPCEACHANAVFKGTPTDCAACHGVGTAIRATAKPASHILSTNQCASCHTPIAWKPAVNFDHTQARGSCSVCHNGVQAQGKPPTHIQTDLECDVCHTTLTWAGAVATLPPNHIPITALCGQCHTTGDNSQYSVTGTHIGVTECLSCHAPAVANTFANVTIVTTPSNHIPIGSLDCNGSGCHTTNSVNPGGFNIGTANVSSPSLDVAGHTTVAAAVSSCATCHENAPYMGMVAGSAAAWGDSRPTAYDAKHPTNGDCGACHTTAPTFIANVTAGKPSNHIPTSAPCAQCHTGTDYAHYSAAGTHQGVTECLSCHGPSVATTFANITIVSTPSNHIPIGSVDCNGSGCHTISNVNAGGFKIGTANISNPTLSSAGHITIGAVGVCASCHETAAYLGMIASTSTTAGDSRPNNTLDSKHPTTGDCGNCHVQTPTFASNLLPTAGKPTNHIPTSAACAQCHTTAGNFALYSVTGTHQGVTGCVSCHGSTVATTFANITIVSTPSNHFPIGSLDCNGSGCHTANNVNPGGFLIGAANLSAPTLAAPGHTTVATAVSACQTCHEAASFVGMMASTATAAGDSRPQAFDKNHPASGDCSGCHTTTPTFTTNQSGSSAKPTNHIPTNAPCAQCHTTAGNYGVYIMGATGHAGITNNCAQCHAYGLSFYNMAPPTLKVPTAGATGHIPVVPPNGTSTIACELCHAATTFTTFASTVMRHAYVTAMTCMSCHETGMTWQTSAGARLWTRPNGHHKGQDCGGSGCHNARDKRAVRPLIPRTSPGVTTRPGTSPTATGTTATTPAKAASGGATTRPAAAGSVPAQTAVLRAAGASAATATGPFNHSTVTGTACVTCHNAASGSGKTASHIATSDNCQACHTTLAWLPVRTVDHAQVKGTCVSCHNGTVATGKSSHHIATRAACESCHTSNAWTPARFDHAAVAPHTCTSCHNAVQAIGMPRTHIPTTQSCDTCHGTLAWKPAKVDHTTLTSNCAVCHNNAGAVGQPPSHMVTRRDCATCHSYPDWSLIHFRHVSASYPGDHRTALACTACHSANTEQVAYSSPANAGSCGGCHAKDFKPAAHSKTMKGLYYSANELANCTGACHVYSDTTQSTITKSLPGPYHRVSDAAFKH
jgi:hypothetical protein